MYVKPTAGGGTLDLEPFPLLIIFLHPPKTVRGMRERKPEKEKSSIHVLVVLSAFIDLSIG